MDELEIKKLTEKLEPELAALKPLKRWLYHGTSIDNARKIINAEFESAEIKNYGDGVYFFGAFSAAKDLATQKYGDQCAVIEVELLVAPCRIKVFGADTLATNVGDEFVAWDFTYQGIVVLKPGHQDKIKHKRIVFEKCIRDRRSIFSILFEKVSGLLKP